jgi:hypothetical protein
MLRLTPPLPRSVGLGPVFFPAQWSFGHRSIHRKPVPLNPADLIELLDSGLPELEEDACFHPLLKSIMCRRMCAQLSLVQSLPLASGSQDKEDRIGTVSIGHTWPSAAKAMRIDMHGQQRLEDCPQFIGNAKSRRRPVIRRSPPFSFLGFLFFHPSYCSRLFG